MPHPPRRQSIFAHADHLEYVENDCAACHREGAESVFPDLENCLDCHEQEFIDDVVFPSLKTHGPVWALNHRPFAKMSDNNCATCHEQQDCLECHSNAGRADEFGELGNNMINVHRSDFQVTHPIAARTDPQLCSSCHETRFCADCHDAFRVGRASGPSHRRTFDLGLNTDFAQITQIHQSIPAGTSCDACHSAGTVALDFHDWSTGHAREARKDLASCQACHPSGDLCVKCHSAVGGAGTLTRINPHGKGWGDRAGRLENASNGKTCKRCH